MSTPVAMKQFSRADVAKHNTPGDCWLTIDRDVLNATRFIKLHPGGAAFILKYAGKDATQAFRYYHNADVLRKYLPRLKVGELHSDEKVHGEDRPVQFLPQQFGDQVPYGDPSWYQRFNSPYYKGTHRQFRAKVRDFVDTELLPTMGEWENKSEPPQDLMLKLGKLGFLACMHGPPYPAAYANGVPAPEGFDYFHELVLYDEIARCGSAGVIAALTNSSAIACSGLVRFGTEELKQRVAPTVFSGEKQICLAISEPNAGSDVAGLITTAEPASDGSGDWIVNGCKKWITNGTYAEYFVTAVKTTKEGGHNGLSLMLLEKSKMPGITVRKVAVRDMDVSGTAYLEFDNVRVPKGNVIGKINHGFRYIMHNFNHERFYIVAVTTRFCRVCIEESMKFALRRKTFGKTLSEHPVIRMKIAAMARGTEMLTAWLESVAYQLCTMSHAEANQRIGDIICLLKAQASKTLEYCARETTHIFGGNALHMTSPGKRIEKMVASVKGYAIPAGAEDIMDDYGARTAFRLAKRVSKL